MADKRAHATPATGIEAAEVQEVEREFNADFLKNMINRLDWDALVAAATTVCEPASERRVCVRACRPHGSPRVPIRARAGEGGGPGCE